MTKQRRKTSLLGIALFLIATTLAAQVTEEWVARYKGPGGSIDAAYAIAVDGAGNVYVTGYSIGSGSHEDYATVKYSSAGVEQWVARYDAASGNDDASAMAIDADGNVYVTGSSDGSGPGPYDDYATVKYSSNGEELWVARYDGPGSSWDEATAMAIDADGNIYVTGFSVGSGTGADYATVKYNSSGVEQWVARYDGPASDEDHAVAIAIDDAGNVYITGWSGGDYATVKYNSNGEELWVAHYDGPARGADGARAMAVDDSGNVYVTGESAGSGTQKDYATVKYSSSGVEQWVARYDGPESDEDITYAIAIDDSGNVYVTGRSIGSGSHEDYDYATIKYSQGPGVAEASPDVPGHRLEVAQLTPEPVITYTLPSSSSISLKVYDVTGKLVRTLVSGSQEAGTHTVTWDGCDETGGKLSDGLYFIRIATPEFTRTAKVIVVR